MCACTPTYENDQQQNHRHRISVDLKDFHTSTDDVHKALKTIKRKSFLFADCINKNVIIIYLLRVTLNTLVTIKNIEKSIQKRG